MQFIGYDIETDGDQEHYALQPWRVREGTARITLSAAYCAGYRKVETEWHTSLLQGLREAATPVVLWNGLFDIAFLYASGYDVSDIKWVDAMHMWKFLDNGQNSPMSWTLKEGAKKFLKDWDKQEEFLTLKSEELPDVSDPYWLARVSMDAEATALIAEIIWPQLTPQQQRLVTIQSLTLVPFAMSWVNGIHLDIEAVAEAKPGIVDEMLLLEERLNLCTTLPGEPYTPSKILSSSAKLRDLLYTAWGLPCEFWTDGGKAGIPKQATHKAALTYLADIDDRALEMLRWKSLNTINSKFTNSPLECCQYLESNVVHPAPKVFGTYTGRVTYGSKIKNHKVGLSIHQTPREKKIRNYVVARPGAYILEFDANGQEVRLMACKSGDRRMIELFNSPPPYDDPHSLVGSAIMGITFEDFLKRKAQKDPEIVGPHGYRMLGKVTTLSIMYRTGPKTLRRVARVQYGINATIEQVKMWMRIYMQLFPGVENYWKRAPQEARTLGYTETLAGRRYKLSRWKDMAWGTSSSAINFPVQGSAADQKELAIAVLCAEYPEYADSFLWDLHDGLYSSIPVDTPMAYVQKMNKTLDDIDYKEYWDVDFPVPFTWEGSFGPTWGNKRVFDYGDNSYAPLKNFFV